MNKASPDEILLWHASGVGVLLTVLLLTTGAARAEPPAASAQAQALLAELQNAYRSVNSFSASFVQTSEQVAFGRSVTATGAIRFARGKMRWDYATPVPQTFVIADGMVRWLQPAEAQVVELPSTQAFESEAAIAALLGGMADIDRFFTLTDAGSQEADVVVLTLTPKFDNPQVVAVAIEFDRKRAFARALVTRDTFGNRNRIVFDNVVKNTAIAAAVFAPQIPEGWHVWRMPGDGNR